jgi:hypothetical protein
MYTNSDLLSVFTIILLYNSLFVTRIHLLVDLVNSISSIFEGDIF